MQLLDILKNIGTDTQQALGRIPPEAMVGVGAGLASGQPGAPLQGFAQGMAAHQQGQLAAEDRELARQKFELQRQELDARLEALQLDVDEKRALAAGRERLATVLKQNPNISPTDAFRLAAMETGSDDWLMKWGDAEQKTAQAQQLQEYRDAMLGISATNAATNAANAQTNAARIAQEQQAKAAERAKETALKTTELDQQEAVATASIEDQLALGDQILGHQGFVQNYGWRGKIPNLPGDVWGSQGGADADEMIRRYGSGATLQMLQDAAIKGAISDRDMMTYREAASGLDNRNQSPAAARQNLETMQGILRRTGANLREYHRKQRSALGGQSPAQPSGGAPAGAPGGKTATRAQIERLAERRGVSVEQAVKDAEAAGFRVLP